MEFDTRALSALGLLTASVGATENAEVENAIRSKNARVEKARVGYRHMESRTEII